MKVTIRARALVVAAASASLVAVPLAMPASAVTQPASCKAVVAKTVGSKVQDHGLEVPADERDRRERHRYHERRHRRAEGQDRQHDQVGERPRDHEDDGQLRTEPGR